MTTAFLRRLTNRGYPKGVPEGYDSKTLGAIKDAFGLYGWMKFLDLANSQHHATGKRALVSQVDYDATVDYDDDGNLAIIFLLPDGDIVPVTIPPDFVGFDPTPILKIIPVPEIPILDFTNADNAIWISVVLL